MARSCYVHIPFCKGICHYCAFSRWLYDQHQMDRWLAQIKKEVTARSLSSLKTLYFGGGTPNCLDADTFQMLSALFIPYLEPEYEWTVECNPEFVTSQQVQLFQKLGVNRISMGVQTFDENRLQAMGRRHTKEQVLKAIELFHDAGITNLSLDLIYGLPGQSLIDVQKDMEIVLSLPIVHLSIYSLQIEENSVFGKQHIQPCDEELEALMYETIVQMCQDHGFTHYEISSFAKENAFSQHNLAYWSDQDFYGFGCGACGKEKGIYYENTKSLKQYLQNGACSLRSEESLEEQAFDAIMMSLRTCFGFDVKKWEEKYRVDFFQRYGTVFEKYKGKYLQYKDFRIKPTEKGMEILNTILVDFLDVN